MENPLVSVIVPVYNTYEYLHTCIDSILTQTYSNLEILLVDDGSTDSSLSVLRQYAEQDQRVKVITKKNGGSNSTRREGLRHCTGEWITLVDSDDSLCPDSIALLVGAASDKTDIVVGYSFQDANPLRTMDIKEWRSAVVKSSPILCAPWGRIFRSSIMNEETFHINYNDRVYGDDMLMNIKIAFSTENPVTIIPNKVYNYVIRESGLSYSTRWSLQMISDLYSNVVESIPATLVGDYQNELIENRVIALKRLIYGRNTTHSGTISDSAYMTDLRNDIRHSSYKLKITDKFIIRYPDGKISYYLLKYGRLSLIALQYIKRKLS